MSCLLIRLWRLFFRWWHRRQEMPEAAAPLGGVESRDESLSHRPSLQESSDSDETAGLRNEDPLSVSLPSAESRSFRLSLLGIDDTRYEPQSYDYGWQARRPRNVQTASTITDASTSATTASAKIASAMTASAMAASTTASTMTDTSSTASMASSNNRQ